MTVTLTRPPILVADLDERVPDVWVRLDTAQRLVVRRDLPDDPRAAELERLIHERPANAERLRRRVLYRSPDYPGGGTTLDAADALDVLRRAPGPGERGIVPLEVARALEAATRVAKSRRGSLIRPLARDELARLATAALSADRKDQQWRCRLVEKRLAEELWLGRTTRDAVLDVHARLLTDLGLSPIGDWLVAAQRDVFLRALDAAEPEVLELLTEQWVSTVRVLERPEVWGRLEHLRAAWLWAQKWPTRRHNLSWPKR